MDYETTSLSSFSKQSSYQYLFHSHSLDYAESKGRIVFQLTKLKKVNKAIAMFFYQLLGAHGSYDHAC